MATIDNLSPGQVLHDYHKYKDGTGFSREGHWLVTVKEIDLFHRSVLVSSNGNPPRWVGEEAINKYRVKEKPTLDELETGTYEQRR